jgi:hypothetical protein
MITFAVWWWVLFGGEFWSGTREEGPIVLLKELLFM